MNRLTLNGWGVGLKFYLFVISLLMKSKVHYRSSFSFVLLLIALSIGVRAEDEMRFMRVCFLSWQEGLSIPLYVRTAREEYQALSLRSNRRSRRKEVPRGDILRLYTDGVNEEGQPIKIPAVDIPVSEEVNEPLVILFRRDDPASQLVGMVVEDAEDTFPFGSYLVTNLTPSPVVFELDETVRPLPPRASALFHPKKAERVNLPMRLLASINGEPKLLRQTFWRHEPDQRMRVFVLRSQDPNRSDLVLRTVAEREAVYRRAYAEESEENH
jgi:hypothetical protein